jgi:hypothetical protein
MPATFEDYGFRFLYPENWTIQARENDPRCEGVTLDLPLGGFFSVTRYLGQTEPEPLLNEIADAMKKEYPEIEIDPIQVSDEDDFFIEARFYYLDLLISSRITAIEAGPDLVVVQPQAESREFDANEPVFGAIIESLRESLQIS